MTEPLSRHFQGALKLHYLEWNPRGSRTLVLLHGGSANAWWWQALAEAIAPNLRLLALDQRGHGDSQAARPSGYRPEDYARDLAQLVERRGLSPAVVVGHSMGGINALAFATLHPDAVGAVAAVDVALTSSPARDRFLRRLKALPTVTYPDLETASARFRLMPAEGDIPAERLAAVAHRSLTRTVQGRYTLKFDRESFIGTDALDVMAAVGRVRAPLLLVRGELSRIMTAEAARRAVQSNPVARLVTISGAHHHIPLEAPEALARLLEEFAGALG